MELRNRKPVAKQAVKPDDGERDAASPSPPPRDLRPLLVFFLLFRLANALLTRTFFQPDEYFQSQEIAHRLVYGYGYVSWEWLGTPTAPTSSYLAQAWHNLAHGPIRSVLHPLLFVPGYWLLRIARLDSTRLFVLFPRLQQACFAVVGDLYTFRLARRLGGDQLAWFATLVNLTNLYTLYTATRTFSNTTESVLTSIALYYWPYVPCTPTYDAHTFKAAEPAAQTTKMSKSDQEFEAGQRRRKVYDANLRKALWLAAAACILRPTNAILWIFLVSDLALKSVRSLRHDTHRPGESTTVTASLQIIIELGGFMQTVAKVAVASLVGACAVDTLFDYTFNQRPSGRTGWPLPALSLVAFFNRNVLANLSVFYGQNAWHWYWTQGVPVLSIIWLPATLHGLVTSFTNTGGSLGDQAMASLSKMCFFTIALMSLLGHKEFRFLQPLLGPFALLAGHSLWSIYVPGSAAPSKSRPASQSGSTAKSLRSALAHLPFWQRGFLLVLQPLAAVYVLSFHGVAQETVPWKLGAIFRDQVANPEAHAAFGKIESVGVLMPCHSLPWASHLHSSELVSKSWSIECQPPPSKAAQSTYMDQSDFFYDDPISYLVKRLPYNVDTDYPISTLSDYEPGVQGEWDEGWRHYWPSHLVLFENLLDTNTKKPGHTRTLRNLLTLKGYKEVGRYWNTVKHEDWRRDGDIVVLAYKGPPTTRY